MDHPRQLYIVLADMGPLGLAGADPLLTLDDAADRFSDALDSDEPSRVLLLEFEPYTLAPERMTDVTDDCAEVIRVRLRNRFYAARQSAQAIVEGWA